jgi:hypothetical protein
MDKDVRRPRGRLWMLMAFVLAFALMIGAVQTGRRWKSNLVRAGSLVSEIGDNRTRARLAFRHRSIDVDVISLRSARDKLDHALSRDQRSILEGIASATLDAAAEMKEVESLLPGELRSEKIRPLRERVENTAAVITEYYRLLDRISLENTATPPYRVGS